MIMLLYTLLVTVIALIVGILMAACSKRAEGVVFGKLDKAGRITNIVLIPVYAALALFTIILSVFTSADTTGGAMGVLGWIVSALVCSSPLVSGLGLGFSASLRKKGKSKASFIVQFAGIVGFVISFIIFAECYGELLASIN